MGIQEETIKSIPKRLFVSCPVCANLLMQAEGAKNAYIKCPKCRNMITIEVERNRVVTVAPTEKSL